MGCLLENSGLQETRRWRKLGFEPSVPGDAASGSGRSAPAARQRSHRTCTSMQSAVGALKFGALTRRRETTNPVVGAIAVEGSRCAGRVGERYIGVRSEQIRGGPGQARRVVFRSPVKDMQRHVVTSAPSHQFGAGRAIDMDLRSGRRISSCSHRFVLTHPSAAIAGSVSLSSSVLASLRSAVSNPSVNQA